MSDINDLHSRFLKTMQKGNMVNNLQCDFIHYTLDGVVIPATISSYSPGNCYVVSPTTQVIHYGRDELPKVDNGLVRLVCHLLIWLVRIPFHLCNIDRVQVLGNQCLSTNCYPAAWKKLKVTLLRKEAVERCPGHSLLLRSLNKPQHPEIMERLRKDGWLSIVNRQVYLIFDHKRWLKKIDSKRDLKLLREEEWKFQSLNHRDVNLLKKAKKYYDMLYLEKYSRHNVQFTEQFFAEGIKQGFLKLYGLYYRGSMLGVVGLFQMEDTLTVPIVGYDTNKPVEMALYRRLVVFTNSYAMERNLMVNQSSGAPHFKRVRGAEPAIEYNFAYVAHLPWYRRIIWQVLSLISEKVYRPILEKYEL